MARGREVYSCQARRLGSILVANDMLNDRSKRREQYEQSGSSEQPPLTMKDALCGQKSICRTAAAVLVQIAEAAPVCVMARRGLCLMSTRAESGEAAGGPGSPKGKVSDKRPVFLTGTGRILRPRVA